MLDTENPDVRKSLFPMNLMNPCIGTVNTPHCVKSVRIRTFFWSVFSRIQTEYEEIRSISPYSVRIRENTDQKNSEYGHAVLSSADLPSFWICD